MDPKKILDRLSKDASIQNLIQKTSSGSSVEALSTAPLRFPVPPSQEEVNQYQSAGALMR